MTAATPDAAQSVRWLAAATTRRSRRSFDGSRVSDDTLAALSALAAEFQPFPGARAVVVPEAPEALFVGIVGAYGGISHAPSAIIMLGADDAAERVGYTGEALVLEAVALGLDTCWVGGLFSSGHAARAAGPMPGERVFAVCALGHALERTTLKERLLSGGSRARHRLTSEEIAPGCSSWPAWARDAVEAARIAPSAMNRQPWRLRMEDDRLVVGFEPPDRPRISKRLDCGIAMLHAEIAAVAGGVAGSWQLLASPDVAVFAPGEASTR